MSTVFRAERERERERDRDWDTGSHGGRSYTTVKRYKIPDLEDNSYESEMRLVHRSREPVHERREYLVDHEDSRDREIREYRFVEREIERSPSPVRHEVREYRIEREVERSPTPPTVREYRVERQYERDLEPAREPYGELERYSRSTEFFRPEQPPPQPIIIRNEAPQPIIVKEPAPQQIIVRREEPAYELIERREVAEPRRDDEYYYERKVKEVDRGHRHRDSYYDEREYGRERYRDAYSDDDLVYIHKEKDTWGRDSSPGSKRHLAGGVIAGVGAAQLMRHHRKRQGEDPGHGLRQTVGYGALGAVGAEVINRMRDRSRSSSYERDSRGRRHHRSRSRHRSRSSSRVKKIGTLAAVASIGALAYAAGRKNNAKNTTIIEDRRSRSRRRKSSVSRSRARSGSRGRSASRPASESALDPEHRNRKVAKAGLATAAVAGIVEHVRNKSRERKGERSRSRIRTGIPIAAAGVTGAAVTGLYERQKAKKEAKDLPRTTSRSRSRSRSKHRSKSVRSARRSSTASDGGLVEYGGSPIRTRDYDDPADHRHRHRSSSSSSGGRRRRRHSRSSRSRSRSKSRTRKAAETAAVAGVAGLAAHEAAKRRDRKKAEKDRLRE